MTFHDGFIFGMGFCTAVSLHVLGYISGMYLMRRAK